MSESFRIRLATPQDAAACLEIYRPSVEASAISFEDVAPTSDEMAQRIQRLSRQFPWLIMESGNGEVMGYAYASPHRDRAAYRWTCEVSVYIAKAHHQQGVGSRLYEELFHLLRSAGYQSAIAGITLPNPASVSIHEKFRFEKIAHYKNVGFKAGAWRDVGWWQLQLREAPQSPEEPQAVNFKNSNWN